MSLPPLAAAGTAPPARTGATLVETLVAVLLLSAGGLALQGVAWRLEQAAARHAATRDGWRHATARHADRIDQPCAALAAGGARTARWEADWVVAAAGATARIDESVRLAHATAPRRVTEVVPCTP
jgi:Tfp pilus assembly protein PilV